MYIYSLIKIQIIWSSCYILKKNYWLGQCIKCLESEQSIILRDVQITKFNKWYRK